MGDNALDAWKVGLALLRRKRGVLSEQKI